jgi:hypothetical protein
MKAKWFLLALAVLAVVGCGGRRFVPPDWVELDSLTAPAAVADVRNERVLLNDPRYGALVRDGILVGPGGYIVRLARTEATQLASAHLRTSAEDQDAGIYWWSKPGTALPEVIARGSTPQYWIAFEWDPAKGGPDIFLMKAPATIVADTGLSLADGQIVYTFEAGPKGPGGRAGKWLDGDRGRVGDPPVTRAEVDSAFASMLTHLQAVLGTGTTDGQMVEALHTDWQARVGDGAAALVARVFGQDGAAEGAGAEAALIDAVNALHALGELAPQSLASLTDQQRYFAVGGSGALWPISFAD